MIFTKKGLVMSKFGALILALVMLILLLLFLNKLEGAGELFLGIFP